VTPSRIASGFADRRGSRGLATALAGQLQRSPRFSSTSDRDRERDDRTNAAVVGLEQPTAPCSDLDDAGATRRCERATKFSAATRRWNTDDVCSEEALG
jgi:hypothetical protein